MRTFTLSRSALTIGAAAALLAGCGALPLSLSKGQDDTQPPIGAPGVASDSGDSLPYHRTFHYSGYKEPFTVPAGVEQIDVVMHGAGGGGLHRAGLGGRVHALIPVTPGETLYVVVGGAGSGSGIHGGFNGGANGGYGHYSLGFGGGGATDVREGGDRRSNRILVAGGGGGQGAIYDGFTGKGGKGGGSIGGTGGCGEHYRGCYDCGGFGGTGGTQNSGGQGGAGSECDLGSGNPGANGRFGAGGHGGQGGYGSGGGTCGGGGGGGGYYGGGGGGAGSTYNYGLGGGGGGGGGSSYIEPNAIKYRGWQGWKDATGNGLVVFSWQ